MPRYIVTFGHQSPFRNGWVEIVADDKRTAQHEANSVLGGKWSMIYEDTEFWEYDMAKLFPHGRIGEVIELPAGYVHA